jgi:flagellin
MTAFTTPMNNLMSLVAQRSLAETNLRLNQTMFSLSTGISINRAADNPSGLVASEFMRSELAALDAASRNVQRADSVLNIADGGLGEIDGLLNELEGLAVQAANTAGMSDAERDAIQMEADSILSSIDRIAGSSSYAGAPLSDGSVGSEVSDVSANAESVDVYSSNLAEGESVNVDVAVTAAAEQGALALDFANGALDLGSGADVFEMTIEGANGSADFAFASGTTIDDVASLINTRSAGTGVEARVSGTNVVLTSTGFGSDEFVSVEVTDDGNIAGAGAGVYQYVDGSPGTLDGASQIAFADASDVRDSGRDIEGTINGVVASGSGTNLSIDTASLSVSVDLGTGVPVDGGANAVTTGAVRAATITGGDSFQIGAAVNSGGRVCLNLMDARTGNLGSFSSNGHQMDLGDLRSGGSLNLRDGDIEGAQQAIRGAISQVSSERARIGAFQSNTLQSTAAGLHTQSINIAKAESQIRDTNFAFAAANYIRDSILQQSGFTMLGIANQNPQNILSMMG